MIDYVIVGNRVAVGRDQEARALAGDLRAARQAGAAELVEEPVERRPRQERQDVVALIAAGDRVVRQLHAHRDDGGLHLRHKVRETDRARCVGAWGPDRRGHSFERIRLWRKFGSTVGSPVGKAVGQLQCQRSSHGHSETHAED